MNHLLAAVDLGSNSFRLSIGRVVEQGGAQTIYQIDRLKETVRLAAGLDGDKRLGEPAVERAVAVLERFGERLHSFHPSRVRAVATNTFRVAATPPRSRRRARPPWAFPTGATGGGEEPRRISSALCPPLPPRRNR